MDVGASAATVSCSSLSVTVLLQILSGFNETLTTLGSSLDAAVSSHVYLNSTSDFAAMNSAYTPFFTSNPPARSTVGVHILSGGLIEIDIVALA